VSQHHPLTSIRDRQNPAYLEFLADQKSEREAEEAKRQAEIDADPENLFKRAANESAEITRNAVLNDYLSDDILGGEYERIGNRKVNLEVAESNFKWFVENTATFDKAKMRKPLLAAMIRSDLSPVAKNFTRCHELLLEYNGYPKGVAHTLPDALVEEEPIDLRSPEEIRSDSHHDYMTLVVGVDESGRQWTEEMLDRLDAKSALRLRRLFEKGHRGSAGLDEYIDARQRQHEYEASLGDDELGETPERNNAGLTPAELSRDFDAFIAESRWRQSSANGRALISEVARRSLTPSLRNLALIDNYLRKTGRYPEKR